MPIKKLSILALALALSSRLEAVTINFSDLTPGNLGTSHYVDVGTGLAVDGLYNNGSAWLAANLYVRDQTDDHGLGVCNPRETPCPGPSGGGDINELDNAGSPELIRLTLPTGYHWVSVQVSSLDDNDGDDDELERGQLWGDVDGVPGFNSLLWQFTGDDSNVEPSFSEFGFAENSPYLFFEPVDWFGETNHNNDFLVYQVTIERSTTPEPATLALLGFGLLAMGGLRRKR